MDSVQRSFADGGGGLNRRQKFDLNQQAGLACWDGVTDYRITRFFGGSNGRAFTTEDAEDTEEF
jgi:hypothetical protein